MQTYLRYLVFILSLCIISLIFFIEYRIGKKLGLKKALYRITYRLIAVVLSFLIAPYLNEYILNYDLYKAGRAIHYNGMNFYRIIDFIEEVIVHNEVLNDLYSLFPSLKNILMDFPQVLIIPFTYVFTFICISLLLLPAYLYLSYKRKRRVLYERKSAKIGRIWAGVLTGFQAIILISIILTPINGLSRMYKESSKSLIKDESNICVETEYLVKYSDACTALEGYNSSVFYWIGSNPINRHLYSSLTKINYDGNSTSLSSEIVSVARAGIVLNKTGLLKAIEVDKFEDVESLNFNELTEEDIDVVVEAFEQSLYTKDVVYEVYGWSKAYLDWLIKDLVDNDFNSYYEYEDIVKELKIVLRVINYIFQHEGFLQNIMDFYRLVDNFARLSETEQYIKGERFFFDMAYLLDIKSVREVYNILKESKIYGDFVPQILDHLLETIDVRTLLRKYPVEMDRLVYYGLDCLEIVQNHKYVYNLLQMFNDLTNEEVHFLAGLMTYAMKSDSFRNFARDITAYGISDLNLELEIPFDIIYEITDWYKELELGHLVVQIVYKATKYNEVDYDLIAYGVANYSDTVCFKAFISFIFDHITDLIEMLLLGKDMRYLVGYYG